MTVMLVFVAAVVVVAQSLPAGPHVTLPAIPPEVSVAQLIVIDDWVASVRYGDRVSAAAVAASAPPAPATRTTEAVRSRASTAATNRAALTIPPMPAPRNSEGDVPCAAAPRGTAPSTDRLDVGQARVPGLRHVGSRFVTWSGCVTADDGSHQRSARGPESESEIPAAAVPRVTRWGKIRRPAAPGACRRR